MRTLRTRFAVLALVLVVVGAVSQYIGYWVSINQSMNQSMDGSINPIATNGYVVMAVMTTLSGFCVAVAVTLVVAIVATLVIEASLDRVAGRGESDVSDESEALAAYGSDPELL